MAEIKAIETHYHGYRFRSRVEARWACFFDSLGVPYEYEKEGYDLGQAGWYLPDFWLPTWDTWIEIKPDPVPPDEREKLVSFAKLTGFGKMHVIAGQPWPTHHKVFCLWDVRELGLGDLGYGWEWWFNQFADCRRCDGVCLLAEDENLGLYGYGDIGPHSCGDHDRRPAAYGEKPIHDSRIAKAYNAARSARFEHGEVG